jgi:hypothetical protein
MIIGHPNRSDPLEGFPWRMRYFGIATGPPLGASGRTRGASSRVRPCGDPLSSLVYRPEIGRNQGDFAIGPTEADRRLPRTGEFDQKSGGRTRGQSRNAPASVIDR